jgi:hypothetical protein
MEHPMQTTLIRPTATASTQVGPRVVETSRGTAHPEHERRRQLVVQSLLLRAERIGTRRD